MPGSESESPEGSPHWASCLKVGVGDLKVEVGAELEKKCNWGRPGSVGGWRQTQFLEVFHNVSASGGGKNSVSHKSAFVEAEGRFPAASRRPSRSDKGVKLCLSTNIVVNPKSQAKDEDALPPDPIAVIISPSHLRDDTRMDGRKRE